jgi:D-alanyl-lipoteichoic acid acyltransferase DltB (MBOAT superfamily)
MIFNSLTYLIFLTIVLYGYWKLNRKNRLYLIFISSLLFYSFWRIEFTFLILFSVLVDYYASIWIYSETSKLKRKFLLFFSLSINFTLLAFFKYYYFISDNVNYLFKIFGFDLGLPVLNIILPIGISFYTFQSVSYTIDVFRKNIKPEKEFIGINSDISESSNDEEDNENESPGEEISIEKKEDKFVDPTRIK